MASLRAALSGRVDSASSGSIAYDSRNGMSRLTASSTAQSAAFTAALEPSMPTTIDGGVGDSLIVQLPG